MCDVTAERVDRCTAWWYRGKFAPALSVGLVRTGQTLGTFLKEANNRLIMCHKHVFVVAGASCLDAQSRGRFFLFCNYEVLVAKKRKKI